METIVVGAAVFGVFVLAVLLTFAGIARAGKKNEHQDEIAFLLKYGEGLFPRVYPFWESKEETNRFLYPGNLTFLSVLASCYPSRILSKNVVIFQILLRSLRNSRRFVITFWIDQSANEVDLVIQPTEAFSSAPELPANENMHRRMSFPLEAKKSKEVLPRNVYRFPIETRP